MDKELFTIIRYTLFIVVILIPLIALISKAVKGSANESKRLKAYRSILGQMTENPEFNMNHKKHLQEMMNRKVPGEFVQVRLETILFNLSRKADLIEKYGIVNAEKTIECRLWLGMSEELVIETIGAPITTKEKRGRLLYNYGQVKKNQFELVEFEEGRLVAATMM